MTKLINLYFYHSWEEQSIDSVTLGKSESFANYIDPKGVIGVGISKNNLRRRSFSFHDPTDDIEEIPFKKNDQTTPNQQPKMYLINSVLILLRSIPKIESVFFNLEACSYYQLLLQTYLQPHRIVEPTTNHLVELPTISQELRKPQVEYSQNFPIFGTLQDEPFVASKERFNFKSAARHSMKQKIYERHSNPSNHIASVKHLEINLGYLRLTNVQICHFLPRILSGLEDCHSVTLHLNGNDFEGGIYEIFDELRLKFNSNIKKFEVIFKLESLLRWSEKKIRASFKPRVKRDSVMFHT